MLTLAVLIFLAETPLGQSQPASLRAHSSPPAAIARTSTTPLDAALESLPEHTALAIVIPDPHALHQRLSRATDGVGAALEAWAPERLRSRVLNALALDDAEATAAGVDWERSAIWVPGMSGAPDLVRLSLRDRGRFEAWAKGRFAGAAIAPWGDGPVHAIAAHDGSVMACAPRGDGVWCQLGASAGPDPLADLRRTIDAPSRRLAQIDGVDRAAARLRPDADAYVVARPGTLGDALARTIMERARRAQPFQAADARRSIELDARREATAWLARAELITGAAAALSIRPRSVDAEIELALSPRGAAMVRAVTGPSGGSEQLTEWARTPSLAHLIVRLDPAFSAEILAAMDVRLPAQILSGSLAAMAVGIDTECNAAKGAAPRSWSASWPFVFPVAGAIGLAGKRALDRDAVLSALGLPRHAAAGDDDVLFRARTGGGPIEGRLVSGALLIGTGPGGGAAARRRWDAAAPVRAHAQPARPFIEAEASLPAIGAALAAGSYDRETRPELRRLDGIARALKPMIQRYPRLRVEARTTDHGQRVRLTGALAP